ncbi:UPF0337 protein [Streptococcus dysgalactiae subsp. equisimilis]|nr:UPF0337 protein [Streptococcus dysgalactiae subsp. equisimilis]
MVTHQLKGRVTMSEEKFDAKRDQISGKIKETVGHLTDDKSLEAEGKAEHTKGKLAEVLDDAKDSLKGFVDHLSGKDKKE